MAKSAQGLSLPADVTNLIDQLERHCLAPDGSYLSKSAFAELHLAREEMSRERGRYLEAMAIYGDAIAMVEEYQQAVSATNLGGVRDIPGLNHQLGLNCSTQVYESLEHRLVVAEAAQRLRLPLLSKDGEVHQEEIEKLSPASRSSFDSSSTSITPSSSLNSTNYSSNFTNSITSVLGIPAAPASVDTEPGIGGVPNRFLGITPSFLGQVQQEHPAMAVDIAEYERCLVQEIEARLEAKCDMLADMFSVDENNSSSLSKVSDARLPERVKLIIQGIEREESALQEDLYSMNRKFAEHYNILEQILGVLIKFVNDLKLQHQHQYDELRKTWLCKRCRTMNAKLSVLEHLLLRDTYTKDSVPALHKIRKYLLEATEEASLAYNKAVTRLREYQGVDPHFDSIARQYHEIVKKLEDLQWAIHQVEMDLKQPNEHPSS